MTQTTSQVADNIRAWEAEDGRVISAQQKTQALKDGGASASSVKPYSRPLVSALASQQEVAAPVGDDVETMAASRYHIDKTEGGFWPFVVRCGTGTQVLHKGHLTSCQRLAQQLKTAFLDGAFVANKGVKADAALDATIDQRNRAQRFADEMAAQIAALTGSDIGEHSSSNCPWQQAILAADNFLAAARVPVASEGHDEKGRWEQHAEGHWNHYDDQGKLDMQSVPVASPADDLAQRVVFDPDLYGLLMNLQNGIKTRVEKREANDCIRRIDSARAASKAATPPGAGGAGVMDARPDSVHSDSGECGRVQGPGPTDAEHHGLDTAERVCFYEQDFYVLSNFSSFRVTFDGQTFDTSEAAYHYQRFTNAVDRGRVMYAYSAHDAFKYAQDNKHRQRPDWDDVKVGIMREILMAKVTQHEYVRRKLLATGDRELVENSWRDDYWGWGPNRDGKNMLGKLWMEVRAAIQQAAGAVPEGCRIVPMEPSKAMLDRAVAFALNVSIGGSYGWTDYMRDLYARMLSAVPSKAGSSVHLAACAGGGVTQWQPIETAPEDGTPIMLADIADGVVYDIVNGHFEVLAEDEDDGPWSLDGGTPTCSYVGRAAGTYFCCWLPGKEFESRWRFGPNSGYTHWAPAIPAPTNTETRS